MPCHAMPVLCFFAFCYLSNKRQYCNNKPKNQHNNIRNSTAYDEFARKWNRPIHEWSVVKTTYLVNLWKKLFLTFNVPKCHFRCVVNRLLVHVYNRRIQGNHSKLSALWITFFFSHLIYEVPTNSVWTLSQRGQDDNTFHRAHTHTHSHTLISRFCWLLRSKLQTPIC